MTTMQPRVAAILLCKNEERNIQRTLESVAGWCAEIHVVDSGSTDRTVELASRFTSNILVHEYVDHASQWTWALDNIRSRREWLLLMDADFVVTAELKRKIDEELASVDPSVGGFFVRHRYVFRGRHIRFGGAKQWWLRLVRQGAAKVEASELVDFRVSVAGETRKIDGLLLEINSNEDQIDFWIDKHQKFAHRMAIEELLRRGKLLDWDMRGQPLGTSDERLVWLKQRWYRLPLFVRPFLYFAYRYFFALGFLDGWGGFLFCFLQALWFRLIVDLKILEFRQRIARGETTLDQLYGATAGSRSPSVAAR